MNFDVAALPELLAVDPARVERAGRRQASAWRGDTPDVPPIIFHAPLTDAQEAIPNPDFAEAIADPDLMLCGQVRMACASANSRSDAVPSARGNYGTGVLLSCLGLEQEVFNDKMPWLKEHLTPEQAGDLTPDDIAIGGMFERGLRYMERHVAVMGNHLPLYCMDTQGPFDLAHLLLGDEVFYLMHDNPDLLHRILDLCVELGIRTHTLMKELSGELPGAMCHSNAVYTENAGVRICEDSTVLIAPDAIREFALPYTQRLAKHFGGGWIHYCGRNDSLTELLCALDEIKGINFGHVPGREHDHVFEDDMERCLATGTIYSGIWPRRPAESGPDYLRRMHEWASRGCLTPWANPALHGPESFSCVAEAIDFWHSLSLAPA